MVEIYVRDNELFSFTRQHKISFPTNISTEIAKEAMSLFRQNYRWFRPIRSVGVRVSDLVSDTTPYQLDLYTDPFHRDRKLTIDRTVDDLRRRFGFQTIQRGCMYKDRALSSLNAKEDNTVHPHGYMERGNRVGI